MLDDMLEALSDGRRREILYSMDEEDSDIFGYDELVEELIEDGLSPHDKDEFKVDLIHMHLPKLEESGIVEHDQRSETIRYTADENVSDVLEFLYSYE